ncbi:MAG: hypothetical protein M1836_000783 [Candelina mexicana]|nr:MAG: hypothetical protein M1836_000783 [Candelina mexicana]
MEATSSEGGQVPANLGQSTASIAPTQNKYSMLFSELEIERTIYMVDLYSEETLPTAESTDTLMANWRSNLAGIARGTVLVHKKDVLMYMEKPGTNARAVLSGLASHDTHIEELDNSFTSYLSQTHDRPYLTSAGPIFTSVAKLEQTSPSGERPGARSTDDCVGKAVQTEKASATSSENSAELNSRRRGFPPIIIESPDDAAAMKRAQNTPAAPESHPATTQCKQFVDHLPSDPAERKNQHLKSSKMVQTKVLPSLDEVQTEGDPGARQRRKQLAEEAQALLGSLDALEKADFGHKLDDHHSRP